MYLMPVFHFFCLFEGEKVAGGDASYREGPDGVPVGQDSQTRP